MRLAKFPRVTPADWCGEHVRVEEGKPLSNVSGIPL
jgi:hypothetical protein